MDMVVVTGATGHIGNVLVRELLSRGKNVRVVIPPSEDTSPIDGLAKRGIIRKVGFPAPTYLQRLLNKMAFC